MIIVKPYIKLFDINFKIDETANMTFALFNALLKMKDISEKKDSGHKNRHCRCRERPRSHSNHPLAESMLFHINLFSQI